MNLFAYHTVENCTVKILHAGKYLIKKTGNCHYV